MFSVVRLSKLDGSSILTPPERPDNELSTIDFSANGPSSSWFCRGWRRCIAGQSESYLARQLWDFKNGRRGKEPGDTTGAQMLPMAAMLTDGDAVANITAYIAAMPAAQPAATVEGDIVNGQKLFTNKCGACHGGQGWGNEALFTPRLTIIGDWYLIRQVGKFKESMRGVHEDSKYGQQMAMMAKTVSEDELNDIAAFLNEQDAQQ